MNFTVFLLNVQTFGDNGFNFLSSPTSNVLHRIHNARNENDWCPRGVNMIHREKESQMRNAIVRRPVWSIASTLLAEGMLMLLLTGCGSTLQLASKWNKHAIQIDGSLKDWSDSTLFIQKDDIRCGVMNDGEFLYVCVISSKPNLGRQLMFRGMTVWFDPNGGSKKTYGVRFPIGMRGGEIPLRNDDEETDQRGNRFDPMNRQSLSEFEFLGPNEKDLQMVSRLQGQGVEMHLTSTPERFVYQLKVPLAYSSAHPYAIETRPGAPIGVGVETNTFQRPMETEGRGEGGSEGGGGRGGMSGRGGGRGGRSGGGPGSMGNRPGGTPVSFDVWMHVQLADMPR
jgi:hypothetical protein